MILSLTDFFIDRVTMDFARDAIKYLYENDLRHGSLEKCKQYLEKNIILK